MPAASNRPGRRACSARPRVSGIQRWAARLLYRACGQLRLREVGHTHAAASRAGIDSLHAINSALSVDLLGQVNGEFLSGRQMSDVGGLPDFIAGARQSAAGRGIIALPASTPKGQCRIVLMLPTGPVSLARVDAVCIVTEHGVADLRHLDVHQRAAVLIAIAAPGHREGLATAWHDLSRTLRYKDCPNDQHAPKQTPLRRTR